MIHFRPFRAWRPTAHTAHLVGSRSYVQYTAEELEAKLAGNPYTFLQIIHADHREPGLARIAQYDRVRGRFLDFVREGILVREERPSYYVYQQSCSAFTSRGLIGALDVADYVGGRVRKHEQTLAAREELFTEYLEHTGINAEPVLMGIPDDARLETSLDRACQAPPLFDFVTTDRIRHRFWRVDDREQLESLRACFDGMAGSYIADGHHRCASSARLARQYGAAPGTPKGGFMAMLVPESQLHILNYDRAVKGLNGLTPEDFRTALQKIGPLRPLDAGAERPAPGHVHVYVAGAWQDLALPEAGAVAPVEQLDAQKLSELVLGPVLGITDLRSDPRMRFVPGSLGKQALVDKVDSGKADVAFHLRAITFGELRAVADSDGCMPPKTTWIEPKLRSGLTIYSLEDE